MNIEVDQTDAFSLLAAMGLAAILDSACVGVRLRWITPTTVEVSAGDLSDDEIAAIVRFHAEQRATNSWVTTVGEIDGAKRAPLSPRIGTPAQQESWISLQTQRHAAIDAISPEHHLDLRFVGSLGEPAYWAIGKDRTFVDYGASAWEMKTRNRGEEFVQNRLAHLAQVVSKRTPEGVRDGLTGVLVRDEAGKDSLTSRTPTGLRAPGPADNARAWCALWGISFFPVRPMMAASPRYPRRSRTAGTVYEQRAAWFAIPRFGRRVTMARVRSVARSAELLDVVRGEAAEQDADATSSMSASDSARAWLRRHGVVGLSLFRQVKSDNINAPEPWLLPGRYVSTKPRV